MKEYRIAFVGMGSIGQRHLKNVCECLTERGYSYAIDLYRSSFGRVLDDDILSRVSAQYDVREPIPEGCLYDIVFVTNPTSMHLETVLKFKDATRTMFIEKPVFDTSDADEWLVAELDEKPCYVACPLRYNPVFEYVSKKIEYSEAISVRAISSSYLPDWRPGQDYRQCYSAHRNMGGGVGIDLIHEWDYLTWLFGMPSQLFSVQDKISELEIDSDDIAVYLARCGRKIIELHLDYFGRKPIRQLELYMPDETVICDIRECRINFLKSGKTINFEVDRNAFHKGEIMHFLDIVDGKTVNDSTVGHAVQVLKLAKGELK